jgi:methyl-accepting chemotaxis protein
MALVGTLPTKDAFAKINRLLLIMLGISVAIMIVIALALTVIIKNLTQPLKKLDSFSGMLAQGDFSGKSPDYFAREVSQLANGFNTINANISALVSTIHTKTETLQDTLAGLAANVTETAASVNQITANMQSIKTRVVNQSASVTETSATMEQITDNIRRLNDTVEKQSEQVSLSSAAVEEMIANIQSVTNTLEKNMASVNELSNASSAGRLSLQEVSTDIQEISKESEGLLEINAVMENIASQTNLLSMNAAIEAAHAGEAGKGFAVVADEIRKLAENSSEQSKTISTVLKRIQGSIDKMSTALNDVLHKFEAIEGNVLTVSEQVGNIQSSMEEQNTGGKQILDAISSLNELTQQVKNGSHEMLDGSQQVIQESHNLEQATAEIQNGMNEIASGTEQINTAIGEINGVSSKNKDTIDDLLLEVSKFKTGQF